MLRRQRRSRAGQLARTAQALEPIQGLYFDTPLLRAFVRGALGLPPQPPQAEIEADARRVVEWLRAEATYQVVPTWRQALTMVSHAAEKDWREGRMILRAGAQIRAGMSVMIDSAGLAMPTQGPARVAVPVLVPGPEGPPS